MEKNPVCVFLSISSNSPYAGLFERFCGQYYAPEGQQKLLFLNCSKAVSEGAYLAVTVMSGPNQDQEWNARIPSQYVLLITDAPLEEKKIGFIDS